MVAWNEANIALLTLLIIVWVLNVLLLLCCCLYALRRRRSATTSKAQPHRRSSPTADVLIRSEQRQPVIVGHQKQAETSLSFSGDSQAPLDGSGSQGPRSGGSLKRTPPTYPSNNYSTQKSYASRIRDDPDAQSWTTQTSSSTLPAPRPAPNAQGGVIYASKSQVV